MSVELIASMTTNADPISNAAGAAARQPMSSVTQASSPRAQPGDLAASADDQLRASTYALLGALMTGPPNRDMLERLRAIAATGEDEGGAGDRDLAGAWSELRRAAEEAELEPLEHEYQELFIGLGRGQVVPFGSWYMTGFMMDQPLAALREDLNRLGFERLDNVKEPEDHAGALLETMAWLASEGEHQTTQRRFFERHLAPWMKTFFKDMQCAPAARFYRAVGAFGESLVSFEHKYLSMQA